MNIGKVSTNVLKRSVLRQIHTRREEVVNGAGIGVDCAVFSFPGDTVTCVQEAALTVSESLLPEQKKYFAEQRTMTQLIRKCVNNLAAKGAEPVAVLITLLLPDGLEESNLKELMSEAEKACGSLHIQIAGGQTRITGTVAVPYGVVTGIGKMPAEVCQDLKPAAPGQDVVISKWIGLEGTAFLAKQYRKKLLERYPAWLVEEAAGFDRFLSVIPEAATAVKSGVCGMHDVSRGGIFGALWELAQRAGVGLEIDMKKIPVRQETIEICEFFELNPYELLSGGCLLMAADNGRRLADALTREGIPAAVIGRTTSGKDRVVFHDGERRYLDRAKTDQIYMAENGCKNKSALSGQIPDKRA